jgi:hypothetical protein
MGLIPLRFSSDGKKHPNSENFQTFDESGNFIQYRKQKKRIWFLRTFLQMIGNFMNCVCFFTKPTGIDLHENQINTGT